MANPVIDLLGENGFPGATFHIPVDPKEKAIFCEGHGRAIAFSEMLNNLFNLKVSVGNEREISKGSEKRKPIKAFPVYISGLKHENQLKLSIKDPIVAAGIAAFLDDKHIHSRAKIMAITDSKRQTGGSRNGNGNRR